MNNNIMAKTVKEAKADIFLRDTDTQSLFNNSGVLLYKYYHEWNDCYNSTTGDTAQINGEIYDEDSGTYKPNCPSGYDPVFNGRLSALWDNLSYCFSDRIKTMYQKMRENGLSYKDMLTKYKDFWKYWCENLYNADAFGYANTNNFTKAYGDKVQVVDYFFSKRQRYLDSKYNTGLSTSNNLRFRLYEKGNGFALKYYQAIYSNLHWGSRIDSQRNIKPGEYSYMPFLLDNPQNATFDIDDADLITELSTYTKNSSGYTIGGLEGLGDFYFDQNMILLKRLTKFVMNYTASNPNTLEKGTAFDLSGMKMLKQVIVRNVTSLSKSIVLSSDLLEEVDFTGTPITGLSTPPTDMLTKLILPDTIKTLNLVGYTNLQPSGLQVGGYSNIETLDIEDCPNLDSYSICKACYDAGAKLSNVTLVGIDWQLDEIEFLLKLAEKKANLSGRIVLTSIVSFETKRALVKAFGDIDNESSRLHITYESKDITSINIEASKFLYNTGDITISLSSTPSTGNTYNSEKWSISENDYATIDSNTGVLSVKKIGTADEDSKATISVTVTLKNNTALTASKEVKFYKKALELGDILFANGLTSGSVNDYKSTPVGVCFYIDNISRKALFVNTKNATSMFWGICDVKDNYQDVDIKNVVLTDNPLYSVYDIASMTNITKKVGNLQKSTYCPNGTFVKFDSDDCLGYMGFVQITQDIYDELGSLLDDAGLKLGDRISVGQLDTFRIIKHRNIILSDSSINRDIPRKQENMTEMQSLNSLLSIISSLGDKYKQYYYPAGSYCYAFEPTLLYNETLADNLTAHHWFLPSSGELGRYIYYYKQGFNGDDDAIFSNAYKEGAFKIDNSKTTYHSSTEQSGSYQWGINVTGEVCAGNYNNFVFVRKNSYDIYTRPIIAIDF